MRKLQLILILAVLGVCGAVYFGLAAHKEGDYTLTEGNYAIQRKGASHPFLRVEDLPDSVPEWFPHAGSQRFINKKFHFIAVSPDQQNIAFACGEGDQWLGIINTAKKYMKFIVFGIQTKFMNAVWFPDNKYLAYSFAGPDKRMMVFIIKPPEMNEIKPTNMNAWFKGYEEGESIFPIGWKEPADTIFTFVTLDASGKETERINLNLHYNPDLIPDYMRRQMKQEQK